MSGWKIMAFLLVMPCLVSGQISKSLSSMTDSIEHKTHQKWGKDYEQVNMKQTFHSREIGKPSLPVKYYKFYVPKGKTVIDVTYTGSKQSELQLNSDLIPAQHPVLISMSGIDTTFDAPDIKVYGKDTLYPANQATILRSDFIDGDMEIVTIAFYPMQYNPKYRRLVISTGGVLSLTTTSSGSGLKTTASNIFNNHTNNPIMINTVKAMVENPSDVPTASTVANATENTQSNILKSAQTTWSVPFYQYVVVTSRALKPAFTQFISWKKRKGYNAGIVCIEDILSDPAATGDPLSPTLTDNAGKLRQYLMAGYNNTSPKTTYALLGGDYSIVPIRYGSGDGDITNWNNGTSQIPADIYFSDFNSNWTAGCTNMTGCDYSGFDYGPEIYVGRLLCTSPADIANWTAKVLQYEQNPGNGDYTYLAKSLFTEADYVNQGVYGDEFYSTSLPTVFTTQTSWSELPSDASTAPTFPKGNDVISALNGHYGIYCVFNHGGPTNFGTATYGNWSAGGSHPPCPVNYGPISNKSYTANSSCNYNESANGFEDLTNSSFPTMVYSVSCENIPFDNYGRQSGYRTLSEGFTVMYNGGGHAYLGNTRDGWIGTGQDLETNFFSSIVGASTQLGLSEGNSKVGFYDHWTCLTHNLTGCPETPMWTVPPITFSPTITVNGSTVTVTPNAGAGNDPNYTTTVTLMSAIDNGNSYFVSSGSSYNNPVTFTNVVQPYYITITQDNIIPYLQNPTTVYIQNMTLNTTTTINGQTVSAGYDVTGTQSYGNVVIPSGANVVINATGNVLLKDGFQIQAGATFTAK